MMMIENAKAHKSHSSCSQGGVAVVGLRRRICVSGTRRRRRSLARALSLAPGGM